MKTLHLFLGLFVTITVSVVAQEKAPAVEKYYNQHYGMLPRVAANPLDAKLPPALLRAGDAAQPFRASVGGKEYDFAELLRLRPADTDGKEVKILVPFKFSHPGTHNDLRELTLIKKQIADGQQPRAGWFEQMKKHRYAAPDYAEKMKTPPVVISCDFSGRNDNGSIQEMRDANAAYTQALLWVFTGSEQYALNAAKILNVYATTVTSHEGKNWYLEVAWAGEVFPLAADILKATYPAWQDEKLVGKWFNDVFLPVLHNRAAFGNREFAVVDAMATIAVFNEDTAALYEALNHWMNYIPAYHYLAADGAQPLLADYWLPDVTPSDEFLLKLNAAASPKDWTPWTQLALEKWNANQRRGKFGDDITGLRSTALENPRPLWDGAPVTFIPGYSAETARDLAHVGSSFASEINTAETAWHQGVDIYTPMQERLTLFMETHLGLRLGKLPPQPLALTGDWEVMKKLRDGVKLEKTDKVPLVPYGLVGTWEIAYNHYHNRKGVALPNTEKIITVLRHFAPEGHRLPKGTPANADGLWEYPAPAPLLFASDIGGSVGWISSWEALTHGELDAKPSPSAEK